MEAGDLSLTPFNILWNSKQNNVLMQHTYGNTDVRNTHGFFQLHSC